MIPIDQFAKSKNLTTDQVLEGVKAGIYDSEFKDNQLYIASKEAIEKKSSDGEEAQNQQDANQTSEYREDAPRVYFKNQSNGFVERTGLHWLWTLGFGPFYFAYRGVWPHFVILFFLPFFYNYLGVSFAITSH